MTQIGEAHNSLSNFLNWNKARINCLAQILRALLQVRTVNLTQIAAAFQSDAKEESSYRRVCRFFTSFTFDLAAKSLFRRGLDKLRGMIFKKVTKREFKEVLSVFLSKQNGNRVLGSSSVIE